jgi:hypothetical protein
MGNGPQWFAIGLFLSYKMENGISVARSNSLAAGLDPFNEGKGAGADGSGQAQQHNGESATGCQRWRRVVSEARFRVLGCCGSTTARGGRGSGAAVAAQR